MSKKKRRLAPPGQLDLFGSEWKSLQPFAAPSQYADAPKPDRDAPKDKRAKDASPNVAPLRRKTARNPEKDSSGREAELLATAEAARRLGIGVSTLEKMRAQRRGPPFVRFGGNIVRYRLKDLDAWVLSFTRR